MVERRMAAYKRIFTGLLAMLFLAVPAAAEAAGRSVFDRASLFSAKEEDTLQEMAEELEETYEMYFLILTTDDADGLSSRDYAETFYEEEGYVSDKKRGGIVLLIDMDNRELNLVTNKDMIYYITDEREEKIYDAGYKYVSDGEYGRAMTAMLKKTAEYMKKGIPDNQYTYDSETGKIRRYRSLTAADWMIAVAAALAAAAGGCVFLYRQYSKVKEYEYSLGQNADIKITGKEDRLANQFVTHRRIPRNPPPRSGGGSFGGRSTTHMSGGGNHFGGGHGRKF